MPKSSWLTALEERMLPQFNPLVVWCLLATALCLAATCMSGRQQYSTTQLILSSRSFTQALQVATLIFGTAGILAIIPPLRPWIGWGLIASYVGVLATFDYGFQFNALLTALYFLPIESLITRKAERRHLTPVS